MGRCRYPATFPSAHAGLPMSVEVGLRLGTAVRTPVRFRLLLLAEEDVDVRLLDHAKAYVDGRARGAMSAIALSLAEGPHGECPMPAWGRPLRYRG
jgi:hypothetical protein